MITLRGKTALKVIMMIGVGDRGDRSEVAIAVEPKSR